MASSVDLSVVVPAYDEAPNLAPLVVAVRDALAPTGLTWELLIVDDGSQDATPDILARLAADDARVRPLHLAERSGQTAALVAGFAAATGRRIATLDADLQCAPADLPALLAALDAGADMACGVRGPRNDPWSRRAASASSNLVRRLVLARHLDDLACPLRVFDAGALRDVQAMTPLFAGAHRWLPALFVLAGLRVVQRPVTHHPRRAGTSKYTTHGRLVPVAREAVAMLRLVVGRSPVARGVGIAVVLALCALPFFYRLGAWPLMEPDEGRNAEVAREMLFLGDWAIPHFNLLPYLDKPVMLFWLIAGAFRSLGIDEASARLPAALMGWAIAGLAFVLGRRLFDTRRALLGATIVATAPMVMVFGRLAIFDVPFTALVTVALIALVIARLDDRPARWLPLAGLAMGLAVLTKGPVGVAVPLLAWVAGRGALPGRRAGWRPVLVAFALGVAVVVPWLVVVARAEPDFLHYALVDETLMRFLSPARFRRSGPVYYYAGMLGWALGVWGVVLAGVAPALVRRWRAGGPDAAGIAFLARVAAVIVLFFTCSASKRPQYILPAMVPLALLTATGVLLEARRVATVARGCGWVVSAVGLAGVIAAAAGVGVEHGDFRVVTPPLLLAAGSFLLAWGGATVLGARRPAVTIACCALFAPGLQATLIGPLMPYAEGRSSRTMAERITPTDRVVCFEAFRTSLPFYLGRAVPLLSDTAHELTSNYVISQRARLTGREGLLPVTRLSDIVAAPEATYLLTSTWRIDRLNRLSPEPLEQVYRGRREILLRPTG